MTRNPLEAPPTDPVAVVVHTPTGRDGALVAELLSSHGHLVRRTVTTLDLARQMIALSGRSPGRDIEIEITGLRPGEKLTEALLDETETSTPCAPKVMEVVSASALRVTAHHLAELQALALTGDTDEVRRTLFDLVAQIRGDKPTVAPPLRIVANR